MSSAVQNSVSRSALRETRQSPDVDVTMIDTLRAIAPSIDPFVQGLQEGTQSNLPFEASRQFMDLQQAAANARVALEEKFPEFKGRASQISHETTPAISAHVRDWAHTVHGSFSALEERIRQGYRNQEDPVAVRNAVIIGDSDHSPSALKVLSFIICSRELSNFDVSDPRNARALGVRSNLAELLLTKKAA